MLVKTDEIKITAMGGVCGGGMFCVCTKNHENLKYNFYNV